MSTVPTKSVAREYLEMLVGAVILALFVRAFIFQAFKIPTGSMEPNLLIGDHLLVDKLVFSPSAGAVEDFLLAKRPIARGDVLVFKFPEDPTRDFIKRVIGVAGVFRAPKYLSIQPFSAASSKLPTTIRAALSGR